MTDDPDSKTSFSTLKNEWKLLWNSLKIEDTDSGTSSSHHSTTTSPSLSFQTLTSQASQSSPPAYLAPHQLGQLQLDLSQRRHRAHKRLEEIARDLDQPEIDITRRDELHEEGIQLNEELQALNRQIREVMTLTSDVSSAV